MKSIVMIMMIMIIVVIVMQYLYSAMKAKDTEALGMELMFNCLKDTVKSLMSS